MNGYLSLAIEEISPKEASRMLMKTHTRLTVDFKVDYLVECMEEGWRPTMGALWIDPDGTVQDGKHRLLACIIAGVSFKAIVFRGNTWDPEAPFVVDDLVWETNEGTLDEGFVRGEINPATMGLVALGGSVYGACSG